ncbi:tRNA ligase [Phlyctochytrium planicorne]|nr:tRNA ligase [Phlyctochytrium planicorne]
MTISVELRKEAYLKFLLHAAKYSTSAVSGLLMGTKTGDKLDVVDVIPQFHTASPSSPIAEISIQQAEIYAQQSGKRIVGVYFANEIVSDQTINPFVAKIASKIEDQLGGGSALLMLDNARLKVADIPIKTYAYISGSWKPLPTNVLTSEDKNLKTLTTELTEKRSYVDLYDFENHLDDIELDWLQNSKLNKFLNSNGSKANKPSAPANESPKKPAPSASIDSEQSSPAKRKADDEEDERENAMQFDQAEAESGSQNHESNKRIKSGTLIRLADVSKKAEPSQAEAPKPQAESKNSEKAVKSAPEKSALSLNATDDPDGFKWNAGESVPYGALCRVFDMIGTTKKRIEIAEKLTKFFREVIRKSPESLIQCCYLCINKLSPEYKGKELGIGESILIKAVAEATGREVPKVKSELATTGDLGTVALDSKKKQMTFGRPQKLTVTKVFQTLKEITEISGTASQAKKIGKIKTLMVNCLGNETKYLIRSLEGKLRIGLAEKSMVVSLAHAFVQNDPSRRSVRIRVTDVLFSQLPDYDIIVATLLEHGFEGVKSRCKITTGIPLKPMLAHPTKSISEVLNRFENTTFACEFKYDGERAQIHKCEDGKIVIFSRNLESLSEKYPDILLNIPKALKEETKTFVLDCEAVAFDRVKKCILPFQVLSTRKRKDVAAEDITVNVCLYAFDLLYYNGKALVSETLRDRRKILHESFTPVEGIFEFAKSIEASAVDEIQLFLDESIVGNCEGLMVKALDDLSSYEPSKRSRNWLKRIKVKKDYLDGVGDSLDLVVIGGYVGRGKRTGWYGSFLLACYDEDSETYQSICKTSTGFTEDDLKEAAEFLSKHVLEGPPTYYKVSDTPNIRPDVWFAPVRVCEVKAADLSISPVHCAAAGMVDPVKGISLRFPRFLRIRDDKSPEQATSAEQVAEMYKAQKINSASDQIDDDEW